jgi:hypothetical protein
VWDMACYSLSTPVHGTTYLTSNCSPFKLYH